MNTARIGSILFRMFFGCIGGFFLALFLMSFERSSPQLLDVVGAPSDWLFKQWHQLGLPPQGKAALAGPFFAFFILWIILGALAGALSACGRRVLPSQGRYEDLG